MSTWSSKDDQSTKSWGSSTPQAYVSPTVTWGTLPSSSSSSCLQTVIDHNTTTWSQNNIVGSPQGWASPPLYPSLGNPPSSPAGSYGGYPSPPVSSSAGSWTQLQLNPLLDSRSPQCLNFDIGALQYMPNNLNGPAVHPPITFIQLLIIVPPFKWPLNIQVHSSVTVSQVIQHLFEFLQGYQNPHDLQKSKVQIAPPGYNYYASSSSTSTSTLLRDQHHHPNAFHSGKRRIDMLGRHRIFRGLSPDPASNGVWVVHLSDR